MTSPDGIIWTARAAAEANAWTSVTYGNGLFVAVSSGGTNRVMTSPDGVTWTAMLAAEANAWTSVTYGNALFVAVSSGGTNRVMTSSVANATYNESTLEVDTVASRTNDIVWAIEKRTYSGTNAQATSQRWAEGNTGHLFAWDSRANYGYQ
jgi:hypothetical protein